MILTHGRVEDLAIGLISRAACGALVAAALLSACVAPPPQPRETSPGHLSNKPTVVPVEIPEPVAQAPFVPLPKPEPPVETYTVVVNEVPVKELLFALSRDAKINVDVHPDISGNVTLNAVDQTLSQILDRISRQIDIRHENRDGTIVVVPDTPFLRTYKIDYVNVTRGSAGTIGASTLVAAGGEGGSGSNTSESTITNTTNAHFWESLQSNVEAIVRQDSGAAAEGDAGVTLNREGGLILVRATARQHQMVSDYLDKVMTSMTRQVLIEATIVEVQLSDRYQAGIDWTALARSKFEIDLTVGSDLGQAFVAGASGGVTGLILNYADKPDGSSDLDLTINLLNEFGDTQVLSSPKVMTLNNQPAVLKVVDNEVYFEISIDTVQDGGGGSLTTVDTDVRTVSVGLVMSVTPQIGDSEAVTLNVRPTITRVREFVDDPGVAIALAGVVGAPDVANRVPVVQVRETETVMRVGTGQLAVLGGLMQDRRFKDDESVPGISDVPGVGELFKFREREQTKTELVVFLRPTVIRAPDIERDFSSFQRYLPKNIQDNEALPSLKNPLSQN